MQCYKKVEVDKADRCFSTKTGCHSHMLFISETVNKSFGCYCLAFLPLSVNSLG